MIGDAHRNTPEMDIKTQDILPPKGTFFPLLDEAQCHCNIFAK
jgi:hypothetical protein